MKAMNRRRFLRKTSTAARGMLTTGPMIANSIAGANDRIRTKECLACAIVGQVADDRPVARCEVGRRAAAADRPGFLAFAFFAAFALLVEIVFEYFLRLLAACRAQVRRVLRQ